MLRDFFHPEDLHVRISDKGRKVLDNTTLATKVIEAIIAHKKDFDEGKAVKIDDDEVESIELATSIKED